MASPKRVMTSRSDHLRRRQLLRRLLVVIVVSVTSAAAAVAASRDLTSRTDFAIHDFASRDLVSRDFVSRGRTLLDDVVHRTLRVTRGSFAFIRPKDLGLDLTPEDAEEEEDGRRGVEEGGRRDTWRRRSRGWCRARVVTSDPASLRVGHVQPELFDCSERFPAVRYVHDGSKLLTSDTVIIVIYRFTPLQRLGEEILGSSLISGSTLNNQSSPLTSSVLPQGQSFPPSPAGGLRKDRSSPAFTAPPPKGDTLHPGMDEVDETTSVTVSLRIEITAAEDVLEDKRVVATLGDTLVSERDEGSGRKVNSWPISSESLSFNYRNPPEEDSSVCTVSVVGNQTGFVGGSLVVGEFGEEVERDTEIDCREFLSSDILFVPTSTGNGNTSLMTEYNYLPMRAMLTLFTDAGERNFSTENFLLPVRNPLGIKNARPTVSVNQSNQPLNVDQFSLLVLSADFFKVEDDQTPVDDIVFEIQRTSISAEEGFLVDVRDQWTPIRSFRWGDILRRRIAYRPPIIEEAGEGRKEDGGEREGKRFIMKLIVYDNQFMASDVIQLDFLVTVQHVISTAPQVSHNAGLVVGRGRATRLAQSHLRILHSGDRDSITLHIRGGLKHGRLTAGRREGPGLVSFPLKDLDQGEVVYRHNGSSSGGSDRIIFRISDGRNYVRTVFIITVIDLSDTANSTLPELLSSTASPLRVKKERYVRITEDNVGVAKRPSRTSADIDLDFRIQSPSKNGRILYLHHPLAFGKLVNSFTLSEINRGLIWYKHDGDKTSKGDDSDESGDVIDLGVRQIGEGYSESLNKTIRFLVQVNSDKPPPLPRPSDLASLRIVIFSSAAQGRHIIGRSALWYESGAGQTDPSRLLYSIVVPPFIVGSPVTQDAGRLVELRSAIGSGRSVEGAGSRGGIGNGKGVEVVGSPRGLTALHSFNQSLISRRSLVYLLPSLRGQKLLQRVNVRLIFAVTDERTGGVIRNQRFDIIILPSLLTTAPPALTALPPPRPPTPLAASQRRDSPTVPLQGPGTLLPDRLRVGTLRVTEGGTVPLTSQIVDVVDGGPEMGELVLSLESEPMYGQIVREGLKMVEGEEFSLDEIAYKSISYIHEGSEIEEDSFGVGISDGVKKFSKVVPVIVSLASAPSKSPFDMTTSLVQLPEGGEIVLRPGHFTSVSSSPLLSSSSSVDLLYKLTRPPAYGRINLNSRASVEFRSGDLRAGLVRYVHTSGEIGRDAQRDQASFSATPFPGSMDLSDASKRFMFEVSFVIIPVDNTAPRLILGGPLVVGEGRSASITDDVVTAADQDTLEDGLIFIIAQTPLWGSLERVPLAAGSRVERSSGRGGKIGSVPPGGGRMSKTGNSKSGVNSPASGSETGTVSGLDSKYRNNSFNGNSIIANGGDDRYIDGLSRAVSSFSLAELKAGRVHYVQSNVLDSGPPTDSFLLYVTDGKQNSTSGQVEVNVIKQPRNIGDVNMSELASARFEVDEVRVDEGGSSLFRVRYSSLVVGSEKSGGASSDRMTVTLIVAPKHGQLCHQGSSAGGTKNCRGAPFWIFPWGKQTSKKKSITDLRVLLMMNAHLNSGVREVPMRDVPLSDLLAGGRDGAAEIQTVYRHDGSETSDDQFVLALSSPPDAGQYGAVKTTTVWVKINPVNDERPKIITNSGLRVHRGENGVISKLILNAVDDDNAATEVRFVIVSAPRQGVLKLGHSGGAHVGVEWRGVGRVEEGNAQMGVVLKPGESFSQDDVDSGRVQYVHTEQQDGDVIADDNSMTSRDSFIYQLTDGTNPVSHETFEIEILQRRRGALEENGKGASREAGKNARASVLWNRGLTLSLLADGRTSEEAITVEALSVDVDIGGLKPEDIMYVITKQPESSYIALSADVGALAATTSQTPSGSLRPQAGLSLQTQISQSSWSASVSQATQFTQQDINRLRVFCRADINSTLRPTGKENASYALADGFDFVVLDRRDNSTLIATVTRFSITIRMQAKTIKTPWFLALYVNVPLTVVRGDRAPLTASNLRVAAAGGDGTLLSSPSPPELVYRLVEAPRHGRILNKDVPVSSFTQADLNAGTVSYRSNSSDESMMDYFLFTFCVGSNSVFASESDDVRRNINISSCVSSSSGAMIGKGASNSRTSGNLTDSTGLSQPASVIEQRPTFFSILIQPTSRIPPTLVRNVPPARLVSLGNGQFGFILSGENLKATHQLFEPRDLVYNVRSKPRNGYLEYLGGAKRRKIRRKFTQRDVDDRRIAYVLNDQTRATNDSFSFRVLDRNRNALFDQRFEMHWSLVQFAVTHYTVCEDAGILSVDMVRLGSLDHTTSVEVRAKQQSAKDKRDYYVRSNATVTFLAGENKATWLVEIVNDGVKESKNEKFKINLRNPINAILGEAVTTNVQLVDFHGGSCTEYIGMISKNQRTTDSIFSTNKGKASRKHFRGNTTSTSFSDKDWFSTFGQKNEDDDDDDDDDDEDDDEYDYEEYFDKLAGASSLLESDLSFYAKPESEGEIAGPDDVDVWEPPVEPIVRRKTVAGKSPGGNSKKNSGNHAQFATYAPLPLKQSTAVAPTRYSGNQPTTSATKSRPIVPQPCTRETRGLLYFDLQSSKMFLCSGQEWEHWAWGVGAGGSTSVPVAESRGTGEGHQRRAVASSSSSSSSSVSSSFPVSQASMSSAVRKTCLLGWQLYGDACYMATTMKATWTAAESNCEKMGGHLTHVDSRDHLVWLWSLAQSTQFWIGLNNKQNSDVWEYTSLPRQFSPHYFNWRANYPCTSCRRSRCVAVGKRMEWINRACDAGRARSVCTRPATSSSLSFSSPPSSSSSSSFSSASSYYNSYHPSSSSSSSSSSSASSSMPVRQSNRNLGKRRRTP